MIHEDITRDLQMCEECEKGCTQLKVSPELADLVGTFLITQKKETDKAYFKKKELAANLEGRECTETKRQKNARIRRRELCARLSIPQRKHYFGELKDYDIQELLTEEEKEIVEKYARLLTKQLPTDRRLERYRERIGGLHFTDDDFVDKEEIQYRCVREDLSYKLSM